MLQEEQGYLIVEALRRSTVWIAGAEAQLTREGWTVRLLLDPNVAGGRAEQQGLRDKSLHSALRQQSVVDLLDRYIEMVNAELPDTCRIVSREFDLSLESLQDMKPAGSWRSAIEVVTS